MAIKKRHPNLQVAAYDTVDGAHRVLEGARRSKE
jgi:hypothetical protein